VALETEALVIRPNSVGSPLPTDYSSHQAPSDSLLAWTRRDLAIADQLTLRYTFSANEIAFQKLSMALRWAQSAVTDTDNYFEKMETARALAKESLAGVRALSADNAVTDAMFGASQLSHQTAINATQDATDKIEVVDANEVAAKLQSVQVQLQASFAATATTNQLSLVNFLT
jgi:flagellin-like hook-associated protein FlgL